MERRDFLKGLSIFFAVPVLAKISPKIIEDSQKEVKDNWSKFAVDTQSFPELGRDYRFVAKDRIEERFNQGYRFVGLRPITTGDMILMKKVL